MTLSSRRSILSSPGSRPAPCARRGARSKGVAKWMLPRPPRPPRVTTTRLPLSSTSNTSAPVAGSKPWVPTGTSTTRSTPPRPYWSFPRPFSPGFPRSTRLNATSRSVVFPSSPTKTTSPPFPPSPPEGPPCGMYFSRRNATHPLPPLPAEMRTSHESMNFTAAGGLARDAGRDAFSRRLSSYIESAPVRSRYASFARCSGFSSA